jgi:hypothetical protein
LGLSAGHLGIGTPRLCRTACTTSAPLALRLGRQRRSRPGPRLRGAGPHIGLCSAARASGRRRRKQLRLSRDQIDQQQAQAQAQLQRQMDCIAEQAKPLRRARRLREALRKSLKPCAPRSCTTRWRTFSRSASRHSAWPRKGLAAFLRQPTSGGGMPQAGPALPRRARPPGAQRQCAARHGAGELRAASALHGMAPASSERRTRGAALFHQSQATSHHGRLQRRELADLVERFTSRKPPAAVRVRQLVES